MKKIKVVEYFIFLISIIGFSTLIINTQAFKTDDVSLKFIVLSFLFKLISGIALWYIYTYYYSDTSVNDIYKYFIDGKQLANIFKNNPSDFIAILRGKNIENQQNILLFKEMIFWVKPNSYGFYNDNQTIIILSSFLNLISNNNLLIAILYMSCISFTATFTLYKTLSPYLEWKKIFYLILFLSPSIALWTTGLLKETIILCSLTIVIYFTVKLITKINTLNIVGFVVGLLLLLLSKPYLFGFILPSVLCFGIIKLFKTTRIKLVFFSTYAFFLVSFITWSYTHNPVIYNFKNKTEIEKRNEYKRVNHISYEKNVLGNNYNILEMLRFKQADYKHEARLAKAKSLISTKKLDGQLSNFFACLPYGLSNGFARPHLLELHTSKLILPALENFLCIILVLLMVLFPRKLNIDQRFLVFYLGTFIVITFIFLGLLVPVLGNLVRYRAPLLPLLFFCLLTLIDKSKANIFYKKTLQRIQTLFQK